MTQLKLTPDQQYLSAAFRAYLADNYPGRKEDEVFELYVADQILKDLDLDEVQLQSGVVDASRDGGIDGLYTFIDDRLVMDDSDLGHIASRPAVRLVAFYATTSQNFRGSESTIIKGQRTLIRLISEANIDSLADEYNPQLISAAKVFRTASQKLAGKLPQFAIEYHYVCQGSQVPVDALKLGAPFEKDLKGVISIASFDFHILGASELLSLVQERKPTVHVLRYAKQLDAPNGGFICFVRLDDFGNLLVDEDGKFRRDLFDSNVRDYEGDNDVNRGILDTLNDVSSNTEFWWLNNGVVATCSTVVNGGDSQMSIENMQIVNGLQTSTIIHKYFGGKPTRVDPRHLLVRVIRVTDENLRDQVIRATNSQTRIPKAVLRGTDEIQGKIEKYFMANGYFYERRRKQYTNEGKPRSRIFTLLEVGQATIALVRHQPDFARARPSTLIDHDAEYKRIFDDAYPPGVFLNCALLVRRIDTYLRTQTDEDIRASKNNVRFYLGLMVACIRLGSKHPQARSFAKDDLLDVDDTLIAKCLSHVWALYQDEKARGDRTPDTIAKSSQFREKLDLRVGDIIGRTVSL